MPPPIGPRWHPPDCKRACASLSARVAHLAPGWARRRRAGQRRARWGCAPGAPGWMPGRPPPRPFHPPLSLLTLLLTVLRRCWVQSSRGAPRARAGPPPRVAPLGGYLPRVAAPEAALGCGTAAACRAMALAPARAPPLWWWSSAPPRPRSGGDMATPSDATVPLRCSAGSLEHRRRSFQSDQLARGENAPGPSKRAALSLGERARSSCAAATLLPLAEPVAMLRVSPAVPAPGAPQNQRCWRWTDERGPRSVRSAPALLPRAVRARVGRAPVSQHGDGAWAHTIGAHLCALAYSFRDGAHQERADRVR